jgi:hypothetical protein
MAKFAKLFDIDEESQVLVTRTLEEEDEEAPYKITVATDYRGIYLAAAYGFKEEEKADKLFNEYDSTSAATFFSGAVEMVEEADKQFENEKS